MKKALFAILPALLAITTSFNYKTSEAVVNYLNTDEILKFNKKEYKLVWSSHPASNYYKQEYIPVTETLDNHKNLILIDYLLIDTPAIKIAIVKMAEVIQRKKTDVVANYQLRKNESKGECILDFLLSSGGSQSINIVEWNGYHYQRFTDKAGHKGVLLFGVSERAYNEDVRPYLEDLKGHRTDLLNVLSTYEYPQVQVN